MGSEGGVARKDKLSPERRKQIAKDAAAKRWSNRKKAQETQVAAPPPPEPSPAPAAAPKPRRKHQPKEFGRAYSVAKKRLAVALKEHAEALQKLAALKEEIPSLVQIIKALGGQVSPQAVEIPHTAVGGNVFAPPQMPKASPVALPAVPVAHGGALGVLPGEEPKENPDIYLEQAENEMEQAGWR